MRRRERPQVSHASELPPSVDRSERRPEGAAVAVGHGEVGDVWDLTVSAANEAAPLVVHGGAREPVAGVEDDVIVAVDLRRPQLVGLVEVEIEQAGVGRAVRVLPILRSDKERRPEIAESKIVIYVTPPFEMLDRKSVV